MDLIKLPPASVANYDGGFDESTLWGYIEKHTIETDDKSSEYNFHFRHRLVIFTSIMRILQDDPATHRGRGRPAIKDLMIHCTTRGLTLAKDYYPEMKEILTIARDIDKKLESDSHKAYILGHPVCMVTLNQMTSEINAFPGKNTHQTIMNNYEYLGLTKYALFNLYFLVGVADYPFNDHIRQSIENILNDFKMQLTNRLYTLQRFVQSNQFIMSP